MKITDYPVITKFTDDQVMLVDGNGGTKTITIADAILAALHMTSPTNHRLVFRGKNLGTVVTTEQLAAIQAGTFEGLWLGDYWVINGVNWRIADFDYWYNRGDTRCTKHHLVIIPDSKLYDAPMNTTNITDGGYIGSAMYTTNLADAKNAVTAAFGDAVLTHREYFTNAVTSGKPSAGTWCDSTVDLPNECMIYGHPHFAAAPNGSGSIVGTIDNIQLALFRAHPMYVTKGATWLRDVVSATQFALANGNGGAYAALASGSFGIRPVFAIG